MDIDCSDINEIFFDADLDYLMLDLSQYYSPVDKTYTDRSSNCASMVFDNV